MTKPLIASPRSVAGRYVAPRHALVSGAITRREWLNFLHKVQGGTACLCGTGQPHQHWLWQGSKNKGGYGLLAWRGREYRAHRFAHIALRGAIPEGLEPDHCCRIPACVNPSCLELVTHKENVLRGEGPSAKHARKTHCLYGHELSGKNAYEGHGRRVCRTCRRIAVRRVRLRERGAK
jgi:hypothetical protein